MKPVKKTSEKGEVIVAFPAVADPDQGYQGLSSGQIFNPK